MHVVGYCCLLFAVGCLRRSVSVRVNWSWCVACGGRCLTGRSFAQQHRTKAPSDGGSEIESLCLCLLLPTQHGPELNSAQLNSVQLNSTAHSCLCACVFVCGWASTALPAEKKLATTAKKTMWKMDDTRLTTDGRRLRGAWAATSVAEQFSKATIRPAVCAAAFIAIFRPGSAAGCRCCCSAAANMSEWLFPLAVNCVIYSKRRKRKSNRTLCSALSAIHSLACSIRSPLCSIIWVTYHQLRSFGYGKHMLPSGIISCCCALLAHTLTRTLTRTLTHSPSECALKLKRSWVKEYLTQLHSRALRMLELSAFIIWLSAFLILLIWVYFSSNSLKMCCADWKVVCFAFAVSLSCFL